MIELILLLFYIVGYAFSGIATLFGLVIIYVSLKKSYDNIHAGRNIMFGLLIITLGVFGFFITITVQFGYATLTIK